MADKEQPFSQKQSALDKQISAKLKENAELVEILEDLEKKNEAEKDKLQ